MNRRRRLVTGFLAVVLLAATASAAQKPGRPYVKKATWVETMTATRTAMVRDKGTVKAPRRVPVPDFGTQPFTVTVWVKAHQDGTILAKFTPTGAWSSQGKSMFLRGGRVAYDIGMVGVVTGRKVIADGKWHHVALVGDKGIKIYIDGKPDAAGGLVGKGGDPKGSAVMIGYTSTNFPGPSYLTGDLDEVCVYDRALSAREIEASLAKPPAGGLVAHWAFEGGGGDDSSCGNDAVEVTGAKYVEGKVGKALRLSGRGRMVVPWKGGAVDPTAWLWSRLGRDFGSDSVAAREMAWEREDRIWRNWSPDKDRNFAELARRYAGAAGRTAKYAAQARRLAPGVTSAAGLARVRKLYLQSRLAEEVAARLSGYDLAGLRATIAELHAGRESGKALTTRLARLEGQAAQWETALPEGREFETWKDQVARLRLDVVLKDNPLFDFDKIVFVKRLTYSANHYYTEYINSRWAPGGALCVLDLKSGKVTELATELTGGVFERFDLSWDARKIVFAWKSDAQKGYRIYEINVDGSGLRQLTFPQKNEEELVRLYRARPHYHHGTDDMHPCYLPNGEIVFISTRCQYGILCDAPDDFTTTILYRMDADGKNMRKLSNSSVSEASPAILLDGRIMYTRWEYVNKGAVSAKCLWAMRPDGSGSAEIYANDISLPPSFIYGRPIPDAPNKYVVLGTPHCPQNGLGTVIRLDMNKNIRTREPMTYMTPQTDIQAEGGFSFRSGDGPWRRDGSGRGDLFKDPFALSEKFYLVAHKPAGTSWNNPVGYGLYLLDEKGKTYPIYRDPDISSWQPIPLKARKRPQMTRADIDEKMAAKNLATCIVTNVYHGMENVDRGTIRYIRVLEQVPRPWASRRRWGGDGYDQQHVVITKDTHLGLKVQHGVVPVEADGSAHFTVPAMANIFFQALDADYMAVQTERTYVNYIPGETRSCIGCHETPQDAAAATPRATPLALKRKPSAPGPQIGETTGGRALHYPTDVQPVLDKHCVKCHSGDKPKAGLDLSGEMTALFSRSYESLIPERRGGRGRPRNLCDLVGPTIGENHPKTGNVHYMPARSFGSHASVLVAIHSKGKVKLANPEHAKMAARLAEKHKKINLTPAELLKITNWVDTNGQFYGSWWGRRHVQYKDHPNFRPVPTLAVGRSYTSPIPEDQR